MADNDAYKKFRFDKFQPEIEQWDYYLQRFELELEMHDFMTDANTQVRRNLLLSTTYAELVAVLNRFYGKKVYIFAERIKFASCFRKENETVTEYVNRLRAVAGDSGPRSKSQPFASTNSEGTATLDPPAVARGSLKGAASSAIGNSNRVPKTAGPKGHKQPRKPAQSDRQWQAGYAQVASRDKRMMRLYLTSSKNDQPLQGSGSFASLPKRRAYLAEILIGMWVHNGPIGRPKCSDDVTEPSPTESNIEQSASLLPTVPTSSSSSPSELMTPITFRNKKIDKAELQNALLQTLRERDPQPDGVDGFMLLLGEGLRRLPYQRSEWKENKVNFGPESLVCYTDGSRVADQLSGAGLYLEGKGVEQSFALGSYATVFQAEILIAILMTAHKEEQGSIAGHMCSEIRTGSRVRRRSGTTGVPGNERADELARSGSKEPCQGPEPFLGISRRYVNKALDSWAYKTFENNWRRGGGCRQAHDLIAGPNRTATA
ncbi:hypothetical protein NQ317_013965 [Molorchus minor]|uniref:RNase H type-1 domain-containing protein n=1 Tax=Molorchus minor TaxID=1323400 RepID=A0ABQ9J1J7_9CUCU|nr:hypothetical protein NQ317_013965 [Molorchus minor]